MKNKVGDADSDRRYESADRHKVIPLGESAAPTGIANFWPTVSPAPGRRAGETNKTAPPVTKGRFPINKTHTHHGMYFYNLSNNQLFTGRPRASSSCG